MTGHRPFSELTKDFTPERRARVAAKAAALRETMTLEELRKARSLSQEEMAGTLDVGQPAVARLEKRTDMHVSNLRRYVEALGGTLEITARFPEASVVLERLAAGPESAPPQVEAKTPAVPIRKSITPDFLICLEDGKRFKSLRRHLAGLGLTPAQYREKWNLPSDYPMVAPNYAAQRSALAKKIGLGQIPRKAGVRRSNSRPKAAKA
jgi:predicted transcriptional regulator